MARPRSSPIFTSASRAAQRARASVSSISPSMVSIARSLSWCAGGGQRVDRVGTRAWVDAEGAEGDDGVHRTAKSNSRTPLISDTDLIVLRLRRQRTTEDAHDGLVILVGEVCRALNAADRQA
ncbi:MAG: hypothetical protein R3B46_13875 [Phycisphaerales bacterium]